MRLPLCLLLVSPLLILNACKPNAPVAATEAEPAAPPATPLKASTLETRMAALRWPLSDSVGVNGTEVEQWIATGQTDDARAKLEERIALLPQAEALAAITKAGAQPGETATRLMASRDLAHALALRWLLLGDPEDARRSVELLNRFAEVVPHWPLYDRQSKPHTQDETSYLQHPEANGLWGRWHPLDFAGSFPLLRAYDIVRQTLPAAESAALEEGLFIHQKHLLDRTSGQTSRYTNLSGYHASGLARFGFVLGRPEYIHQVVRYWRDFLVYSYAPDGYFREVSPSYNRQITHRIAELIPEQLKGYSDPAGYRDAVSGERFDTLDLAAEKATLLKQIADGENVLALPDGSFANFNDAWPRRLKAEAGTDQPGLLGISGIAKLHTGGMSALMKFGGIRGHDHRDALGLVWYAAGKEVFSDTSYHDSRKGSPKFAREWSTSTASHFTTAIDEEIHFKDRTGLEVPEPFPRSAFVSRAPSQPGQHPVEAVLPVAARFLNQGQLLLWDARHPDAQAMEAEQPGAYPGKASLFRRTVVMVPLGDEGGYLVEIFRMRGGKMHDFFLRGGLDEPYKLTFNQPLPPATGEAYQFIRLRESGPVVAPLTGEAAYPDNVRVVSRLAGALGPQPATLQLLVGEASAIRREGDATFSLLRRVAEGSAALETCWIWVHEATKGAPRISQVALAYSGGNAVVSLTLPDRVDRIFSAGEEDTARFNRDGWSFEGHLAYASQPTNGDAPKGRVFRGGALLQDGKVVGEASQELAGTVLSTTSRILGDTADTLLIRPDGAAAESYHLAHIDFGHGIRFSIPVQKVEPLGDGTLRVHLVHSPGFMREADAARMTQFPGWRVQGETRVRLE